MSNKPFVQRLSRRSFLRSAGFTAGATMLTACLPTKGTETAAPTEAPPVEPTATLADQVKPTPSPENTPVVEESGGGFIEDPSIAPIAAQKQNGWVAKIANPPAKYDPPITISQNFEINGAVQWLNEENANNNVLSQWYDRYMGVHYSPLWEVEQDGDAANQKWSTAIAAGDLPEHMVFNIYAISALNTLLDGNQLEDITEIWDKVATPLTKQKKGYPDHPMWKQFGTQGRVKVIPFAWGEKFTNDGVLYYRRDMLEKAKLKVPTTLDELHEVAKTLKDQGIAEVPLTLPNQPITWMGINDLVYGAYGTMPTYWRKKEDGTLFYGSIDEKLKEPLTLLTSWAKEGLFGQGVATKNVDAYIEDLTAGRTAISSGPYWMITWPLPDTKMNAPEADWTWAAGPVGPLGKGGRAGYSLFNCGTAFKKGIDPKKVEATIQVWNWWFARREHWAENDDYMEVYGPLFEGYNYIWEDDKVVPGPAAAAGPWAYAGSGGYYSFVYPEQFYDWIQQVKVLEAKPVKNAMDEYLLSDPMNAIQREIYEHVYNKEDEAIFNEFYGILPSDLATLATALSDLENQVFVEIISGARPIDAFDTFVTDWLSQGGNELTAYVNEWYASIK